MNLSLARFLCHVMFAIISCSNTLNLTNLLDTHHQFHKLCLLLCRRSTRFKGTLCPTTGYSELFYHQQHVTEGKLLNIRHVYSHFHFHCQYKQQYRYIQKAMEKKIDFACLLSRQEQFPGLVQLNQQEQVPGPGTA